MEYIAIIYLCIVQHPFNAYIHNSVIGPASGSRYMA